MANVLLTQRCVRSCPYCFAKEHMDVSDRSQTLTWENLIYIADLFTNSGEKRMSLLGGEPTVHESFLEMALYLIARGFFINVFTSGIMSEEKLSRCREGFAEAIEKKRVAFVCNVNEPSLSRGNELERQLEFLSSFGKVTVLSFNIYRPDFDLTFHADCIRKYNLRNHIRLGLAHPIPGAQNQFLRRDDFKAMAARLCSFLPRFSSEGISLGFDCGFPSCVFTDEELGKLFRIANSEGPSIKFACSSAIDIGPDATVWNCFPLSQVSKRSLYGFNSFQEVREYFVSWINEVRTISPGVFKECAECIHRRTGQCSGGCAAHIVDDKPQEFAELMRKGRAG